jgi:hypothetical protein
MVRKLDILDIPSAVRFLESLFIKGPIRGLKFNKEWVSQGLYELIHNEQALVLVSGESIDSILVGSIGQDFFTGEPIGECYLCWGDPELMDAFVEWSKGVSRVACTVFRRQTSDIKKRGFNKLYSVYSRSGTWDGDQS